jgi:hypothetical protein
MANDAFDQCWECAEKPRVSLLTIDARSTIVREFDT